ncbi:polyprenol monophosphomannose synthase [Leifsonia aquatica]|uniref:polyprenol monophosphomannose synthase n=1 Tax=Leifsonia aquatica TaxID=144185 RepID=UPI003830622D
MPTFDERENLASIARRLRQAAPDVDLLVVDDNSPDGTGALADELALADASISVLHRPGKGGLGAAYQAGMRWALEHGYDVVVEMDADGSHQPEQLHRLLTAVARADLVLGSRWVAGGEVENWPRRRRILSRGGSAYSRFALGVPARDVTGGYRAFRADALERIRFEDVQSQGYCFQIDMLRRTYAAGLTVVEVPITFVERQYGASKMTGGIVAEAMLRVAGWGIAGLPTRWRSPRGTVGVGTGGGAR